MTKDQILNLLASLKTTKRTSEHLGISESSLRGVIQKFFPVPSKDKPSRELVEMYLQRYSSIRLATRMWNIDHNFSPEMTEGKLRLLAEEYKLNLGTLLDWSISSHSNAKGRRAENDFMLWRGSEHILEDMNVTEGSQAGYDVKDSVYGNVNVKSSRAFKLKAQTRKDSPFYWKFSCSSIEKADHVALMFYDMTMETLLAVQVVKPAAMGTGSSITVRGEEFKWGTSLPKVSLMSTNI